MSENMVSQEIMKQINRIMFNTSHKGVIFKQSFDGVFEETVNKQKTTTTKQTQYQCCSCELTRWRHCRANRAQDTCWHLELAFLSKAISVGEPRNYPLRSFPLQEHQNILADSWQTFLLKPPVHRSYHFNINQTRIRNSVSI